VAETGAAVTGEKLGTHHDALGDIEQACDVIATAEGQGGPHGAIGTDDLAGRR
jgi:hypothetical protein